MKEFIANHKTAVRRTIKATIAGALALTVFQMAVRGAQDLARLENDPTPEID